MEKPGDFRPHFRSHQVNQHRIIRLPLLACTVATRRDGSVTSSPSLLTQMHPLIWSRANLDSDRTVFSLPLLQSPMFMLPKQIKAFNFD